MAAVEGEEASISVTALAVMPRVITIMAAREAISLVRCRAPA